jgi:gluconolactonase
VSSPDRLADLIAPAEEVVLLAGGFGFTEGPVWIAAEDCLLFSDMVGDARWRWSQRGGAERVATPTFKGNGQCLDRNGDLLVCEQVSSCLVRLRGNRRELVAHHHQGRYLNSPNDVVVRGSDGSIYFTDPPYGRMYPTGGWVRNRDLDYAGVYRVPQSGGDAELVVDPGEFDGPNGLCFSPDERVLYVNDSDRHLIKAFEVDADGRLSDARVLIDHVGGGPGEAIVDGMECDALGNVWVTGPGGVWVLDPHGEHLGTIATPETATSLVWGGADLRTLFLTTLTTLHSVRTLVASAALPPTR